MNSKNKPIVLINEMHERCKTIMRITPQSNNDSRDELLNLLANYAYKLGDFKLSSGKKSSHYVNCKPVSLKGRGLQLISELMIEYVDSEAFAVAGLTLGADPLVSGVAMLSAQKGRPLDALIVRKQPKGHGTGSWLEGPLPPKGSLITVLEDVVTTGGSSLLAVNQLQEAGYVVKSVLAIVDRQEGADVNFKNEGLQFTSLFLLEEVAARFQRNL